MSALHLKNDITVIGAGFSGSLAALCLHQKGFEVTLLEKSAHPRFAAGESSTPIADMVLRSLADTYDLPWLRQLSRYGSWQDAHPELVCGIKRGFSYYSHRRGRPFSPTAAHGNELLVAASVDNRRSDTHWLRADFDHFLVQQAKAYGIRYFDHTKIRDVTKKPQGWVIQTETPSGTLQLHSSFIIDASGGSSFAGPFLGADTTTDGFKTASRAVFAHFRNVEPWDHYLAERGISRSDYPFDPDHSALHHLLGDRWLWMLRFNDGRTSAGIVHSLMGSNSGRTSHAARLLWEDCLQQYPSLQHIFRHARIADPPGRLAATGRLQRRLSRAAGPRWAALPHTAGFVDPLHSTGIAHTLAGLEKLLPLLTAYWDDINQLTSALRKYQESLFRELEWIDLLVAGCYRCMGQPKLFHAYTMLYFTAAIAYEQQRLSGRRPRYYLQAGDPGMQRIGREAYTELEKITGGTANAMSAEAFTEMVKQSIAPFNSAGLMDPAAKNMYQHTAARLD